ncbi:MAG: 50S ribosomal protein L10 [Thermoanaerobaculia bacterium]
MPLTAEQKQALVERYKEGLAAAPHVFLMGFRGIDVPRVTELRDRVRAVGGGYAVVKNRLALRAIEESALSGLKEHFRGPTAVAWSADDPVALAKELVRFVKDAPVLEFPVLEFKGGLLDGAPIAGAEVEAIASLPSRQELLAKLVFLLQSPITRFVRTLGALPRGLVTVLDQIARKKGETGEA